MGLGVAAGRGGGPALPPSAGVARLKAELAQLPSDGRAGEMGVDLVESLGAERQADVVDVGAGAGAGEREGALDRGGGVHAAAIGRRAGKT